jgi:endonuclease YncB( thermonuclease family)
MTRLAALLCLLAFPTLADGLQVTATVLSVYDGDTVRVEAYPWPDQINRVSVRLAGVDTPELRGKCKEERALARVAKAFVELQIDDEVMLVDVRKGKYAGRVVARIILADGRDLSSLLIEAGLGRAYDGGKRESWCD